MSGLRRVGLHLLSVGAAAAAAAVVSVSCAPLASATTPHAVDQLGLPTPVATVPVVRSLTTPSVSVPKVPVLGTTAPTPVLTVPVSIPVLGGGGAGSPSVPSAPSLPAVPSAGSGVKGVPSGVGGSGVPGTPALPGLPAAPGVPGVPGVTVSPGGGGNTPGSVASVGANASPVATACVQAKGTGSALANVSITLAGHSLTTPLVQALPGVLAPCPAGSGIPSTTGLDSSVAGLVGACVRVSSTGPVKASMLVLDTELVGTLTKAGVPLSTLVVPCPAALTGKPGTPGAPGVPGSGATGSTQAPGAGTGAAAGSTNRSASAGRAGGSGASCGSAPGWATLNSESLSSVMPRNVPQLFPWVLLALALVGRRRLRTLAAAVAGARGARARH